MPVEFDGFKFYFDASKIEAKKANEKRSLVFELNKVREDGTIVFAVQSTERGRKTKQEEILKAIKRKGIPITEEQLERAFRVFEKQSEVDFFINKNAKAFFSPVNGSQSDSGSPSVLLRVHNSLFQYQVVYRIFLRPNISDLRAAKCKKAVSNLENVSLPGMD